MTPPLVSEPARRYRGYRVPSARLPGFDYGHGVFFVTIVTAGRVPWFGRLGAGRVALTEAGRIVEDEWRRTEAVRSDVTVDAFVVMPDHVHGILRIDATAGSGTAPPTGDGVEPPRRGGSTGRGAEFGHDVNAGHGAAVKRWRPRTLGAVVNHVKGACTRRIRATHPGFAWQSRFYDVIVRDARHLGAVRRYIAENPARHAASGTR